MLLVKRLTTRLLQHGVLGKVGENVLINLVLKSSEQKKPILCKVIHIILPCISISGLQLSHFRETVSLCGRDAIPQFRWTAG